MSMCTVKKIHIYTYILHLRLLKIMCQVPIKQEILSLQRILFHLKWTKRIANLDLPLIMACLEDVFTKMYPFLL